MMQNPQRFNKKLEGKKGTEETISIMFDSRENLLTWEPESKILLHM